MERKQYWGRFYKEVKPPTKPSSFAKFCIPFIPKDSKIVEFGCGNGRDTYFFHNKDYCIIGIDNAVNTYLYIYNHSLLEYLEKYECKQRTVYSRFFLHSITDYEINKLLKWSNGLFMAEFRADEDIPILYPDHYRNKINGEKFLKKMIKNNFEILYYSKSKDVAKYKNENPIIIRIIAKKGTYRGQNEL